MKVKTIRRTNRPEELVATAARNNYSSTGANEGVKLNRKRIRERIWVLNHIAPEFAVESNFVSGNKIVEEYRSFVDQGYEGAVVKETGKDTEYKFNKRSSDWRKMIPEHEHIDLRITAVQEGEDSMSGSVGSITVETSDGYELGNVTESLPGTSGTDWDNRRTIIGEIVEVSWRELQVNDDGTEYSLRFPSLEGYRDDKTSADSLSRVQSLM